MAQDLRKMFEKERKENTFRMEKDHEARFLARLDAELPEQKQSQRKTDYKWLKIAAAVVVLFGLGVYFFNVSNPDIPGPNDQIVDTTDKSGQVPSISLGDLSPDLKKIESYYVSNINLELSELDFSEDNKELIDGYMEQLSELDNEYKALNNELNSLGPNDQTINALIKNLQLRLQLLQKLKSKLNQLKSSKNEQEQSDII